MPLVDPEHPFFAKAWTRWLWTLLALAAAVAEFVAGSPMWGAAFLAAGAYLGWVLIIGR